MVFSFQTNLFRQTLHDIARRQMRAETGELAGGKSRCQLGALWQWKGGKLCCNHAGDHRITGTDRTDRLDGERQRRDGTARASTVE